MMHYWLDPIPMNDLRRMYRIRKRNVKRMKRTAVAASAIALASILIGGVTANAKLEDVPHYENISEEQQVINIVVRAEETAPDETEYEEGQETESEREYLGEFTLTAYCSCRKCCGKWSGGPTASGVMPEEGITVAVDKDVIPLGTEIYIDGYGEYTAQDTGSAVRGNHIDVYMGSHQEAKNFGRKEADVYIVKK